MEQVAPDIAASLSSWFESEASERAKQMARIRELSTPVIELEERILLVPVVGAFDDARGDLLMETVLTAVVARSARVLIVDIAGVAVVDTITADGLVKTAQAVRLLGADVVVSGVRPEVARTLVSLGFDVTLLQTCARLSDGVALSRTLAFRNRAKDA